MTDHQRKLHTIMGRYQMCTSTAKHWIVRSFSVSTYDVSSFVALLLYIVDLDRRRRRRWRHRRHYRWITNEWIHLRFCRVKPLGQYGSSTKTTYTNEYGREVIPSQLIPDVHKHREQPIVPFPFLLTSINHFLLFSYDLHQNDENTSDAKRIIYVTLPNDAWMNE